MKDTLQDKVALLFGAATGIGKAAAFEFAKRGANVAIGDVNLEVAQITADEIGGFAIHADVNEISAIEAAIDATEAALGPIDVLVNNVGAILHGDPQDIPMDAWERMTSLNYFSAVRACHIMMPRMIARGSGHIVNTASFAGLYPFASSRIPYAAAKAALVSYSQNLAIHLEPQGVKVSCFCPGPVMTGVADKMKTYTEGAVMCGPGSHLFLKTAEQAAAILADGIAAGRILIPTDELAFESLREFGADPDGFVREKIAAFDRGDFGKVQVSDELKKVIAASRSG